MLANGRCLLPEDVSQVRDACRVPRNRADVDRDCKVNEIVVAAVDQLKVTRFTSLSMDRVARDLGVTRNAVYWYFTSRDALHVH